MAMALQDGLSVVPRPIENPNMANGKEERLHQEDGHEREAKQ